jgi:hypothetical protein
MAAQPNFSTKFIRKTQLSANEYHKNFYKLDEEIIAVITSGEADKVTPLMSKIYLRLVNAPARYWEREGVLRFEAECREGKQVKAWDVLCQTLGVASATANKAMTWLHAQGIIGYFAGKNGVGLRIFLNRAATSIGERGVSAGQKILRLASASTVANDASPNEPAFKDPFGDTDSLDKDLNPHAPKTGADTFTVDKKSSDSKPEPVSIPRVNMTHRGNESDYPNKSLPDEFSLDQIITRLRSILEPELAGATAQAAKREHERTREWLDRYGIPKATRVAQREAYNVLRSHGVFTGKEGRMRAELDLGRAADAAAAPAAPHLLTAQEITETAETCLALLEVQGKSIELTLSEINVEGGGWLLPEDVPRVREATRQFLDAQAERKASDALSC